MSERMTDDSVLSRIEKLVSEEQGFYGRGNLSPHDQSRLQQVEVELDQCWDLLRQRRALREFGKDPDRAAVRPPTIVERYEQ